jgi:4-aminobutyrate aminotransferase
MSIDVNVHAEVIARDQAALSPSLSRRIFPLVVRRAQGVEIEDENGRCYLDFMAGIAVCTTGHCHPRVVAAIQRQAEQFIHVAGGDVYYDVQVKLAEELREVAGFGADGRVFFGNSGTEAVEAAIKLARHHQRRPGIISFVGDFHGRTLGSLGATASRLVQRAGFFVGGSSVYHGLYPNSQPLPNQPPISLDYALEYLREVVLGRLVPASEVAAILVEPIQGEGGYVFPPEGFLPALRSLCDENDLLLIVDEVQTGIGRSGRWFAVDHVGAQPDILVIAKGLASGMPIGAIVADQSVMNWPPGAHANTFGGNPIACAAALETLGVIREENLLANAAERGQQLVAGLRQIAGEYPELVRDPRGLGLLVAFDLAGPDAEARRNALVDQAFQRGLLVLPAGLTAVRLTPPLVVGAAAVERALAILKESVAAVAAAPLPAPRPFSEAAD